MVREIIHHVGEESDRAPSENLLGFLLDKRGAAHKLEAKAHKNGPQLGLCKMKGKQIPCLCKERVGLCTIHDCQQAPFVFFCAVRHFHLNPPS